MSVEFHRQKAGKPWRSMMGRIGRLRFGGTAWHDYAIVVVSWGRRHRSLEVGWVGHVRGFRFITGGRP